jgi:putative DNA primase/helicase
VKRSTARSNYESKVICTHYLLVNVIIRSHKRTYFDFGYSTVQSFCIEDGYRAVGKTKFIQRLNHYKIFVDRLNVGNVAYLTTDRF